MLLLITGGAGYIGSHVVRQLSDNGHQVIVYDNLSTGSPEALIHNEKLIVGDLADNDKLQQVFSTYPFDAVIHFAASIVVPESIVNPLYYYFNNTANTLNLLRQCVRHKVVRFIFSSTAAVYGIPTSGIASETIPTNPINPYGSSKLMSEWILRDAGLAHGVRHVVLRYFNVAGADPLARMGQRTPNATHLIKVACQTALGLRQHMEIFGTDYDTPDGTCIRDYIHIEDLASAHVAALDYLREDNPSVTINVGYGKGSSVREVVAVVRGITGVDFIVKEGPRRPGDPPQLIAEANRIRQLLRWQPQFDDLKIIVADAWRWECKLAHSLSA